MKTNQLTPELLHKMDAYWLAANYLSIGQIHLHDNPLPKPPLTYAAGTLGRHSWTELHLRALEPGHQEVRPRHDLCLRPRARWSGRRGQHHLEGTYGEIYRDHQPGRNRDSVLK